MNSCNIYLFGQTFLKLLKNIIQRMVQYLLSEKYARESHKTLHGKNEFIKSLVKLCRLNLRDLTQDNLRLHLIKSLYY
jgi:hypothetical protein